MPSRDGPIILAIGLLTLLGLALVLIVLAMSALSRPPAANNFLTASALAVSPSSSAVSATRSPTASIARRTVPPPVNPSGWVPYQGQKEKFTYVYPPDWKITSESGGKALFTLRAGGFWSALTDWSWGGSPPDDIASRIDRQIGDAGTYSGLVFTPLNKKPIGDSVHEGYIVEGELKSASAAVWISYAYFRSYHDNVLIFYYFRDRNAANNGDPQTFAKVIASELDADVIVEKKN